MALNVINYKGRAVRPPVNNGTKHNVYTVPAGKVAKIKFNIGSSSEPSTWTHYDETPFLVSEYHSHRSSNSISCTSSSYGACMRVGSLRVLTSNRYEGQDGVNSSAWSIHLQTNPMDSDSFIAPGRITNMVYARSMRPAVLVGNVDKSENNLGLEFKIHKNEFVLTAGESVSLQARSISRTDFCYDFTVYEEDI